MPEPERDPLTKLSEEAASLRALIDTVVDGVVIIDGRGAIRVFNPACERLFGYRRSEVLGANVSMLMPEPYRSEHDAYLDAYRRTGERKIIGIGREVVGRRKDGSTFPMELSVGETRLGEGNAYVGIIRDITERKEAERRLRDGQARLQAIIDTAVDGIILIDAAGTIRLFNPASEWIFGYRAREVLGKNVAMLMPEPYRTQHDGYLRRYQRTGERKIIGIGREVLGQRKDGSVFPMELSVGETIQSGEHVFVGVIRDITERRRAEERQQLLAAEVDHRAKNMLAVIQAIVRQTKAGSVPDFTRTVQGRIAALAHAHTLLSESRWEGADLARLLAEELAAFRREDHGRIQIAGPEIALVPAAAQAMALALRELATNAAKHGALSGPAGRLRVVWQVLDGRLVLHWAESGTAGREPGRRGFGLQVIEQAIRRQLEGEIAMDWRAEGLVCRISIPVAQLTRTTPLGREAER